MSESHDDKQDEVERLKNLVKTLELQNNALKSKAYGRNTSGSPSSNAVSRSTSVSWEGGSSTGSGASSLQVSVNASCNNRSNASAYTSFDDVAPLDISSGSEWLSEEDTSWFYTTPTKYQPSSPRQIQDWVRQDVENPSSLDPAFFIRRSLSSQLLDKLDKYDTSIVGHSTPVTHPYFSSGQSDLGSRSQKQSDLVSWSQGQSDLGSRSQDSYSSSTHNNGDSPAIRSPLLSVDPQISAPVNSGTFTRPKKARSLVPSTELAATEQVQGHADFGADLSDSYNTDYFSSAAPVSINVVPSSPAAATPPIEPKFKNLNVGDGGTFTRPVRRKTQTLKESSVLAAHLNGAENSSLAQEDQVADLPGDSGIQLRADKTDRRNSTEKSKRESLDIQTLARLQEQSLRESFNTTRRASPASHLHDVPPLELNDLDSSAGSASSGKNSSDRKDREVRDSGTFRIRKSSSSQRQSFTDDDTSAQNGHMPTIQKPVGPVIKQGLSPRTLHQPGTSINKPRMSALQSPARNRDRTPSPKGQRSASSIPTPKSGLRKPSSVR